MSVNILIGDCRERLGELPDASVHCCVTSPPYLGLRDYGVDGQMGLEPTPNEFVAGMVEVFREVKRVLRDDGTCWINIGDSYSTHAAGKVADPMAKSTLAGVKTQEVVNESSHAKGAYRNHTLPEKNLIGVPWRLAFALQADGWYLRQDIIWSKPNPMPESVRDRCTKAHEYLFMLSKSSRYHYDQAAIAEPAIYSGITGMDEIGFKNAANFDGKHSKSSVRGEERDKQRGHARRHDGFNDRWDKMTREQQCSGTRNKRSVWEVATQPFSEAHFATYPPALIEPCILAGCPKNGTVLDPFGGAGTTGLVADRLGRDAILIELNPEYAEIARKRIEGDSPMFAQVRAA